MVARTRLAIVARLAEGEARVVDLTRALGIAQSSVSKHLACLRDCGLVEYRSEGRQVVLRTYATRADRPAAQRGAAADNHRLGDSLVRPRLAHDLMARDCFMMTVQALDQSRSFLGLVDH